MPRLISMAKTVAEVLDRTKTVTRRDGWRHIQPGDLLEMVVWDAWATERKPLRRLGVIRVVSVSRERLGDITPEEVAREGLPGMDPESFVELYCAPGKPDPDREVTRIEFRYAGRGVAVIYDESTPLSEVDAYSLGYADGYANGLEGRPPGYLTGVDFDAYWRGHESGALQFQGGLL